MKMAVNKKLLTKWCDALTSRKYKQGTGQIRTKADKDFNQSVDRFCCLGVLCDIADKSKWSGENYWYDNHFYEVEAPWEIFAKLNLPEEITQSKLALMNDEGKKFYQIARFLRKYL
jgi:hypothetical protein